MGGEGGAPHRLRALLIRGFAVVRKVGAALLKYVVKNDSGYLMSK